MSKQSNSSGSHRSFSSVPPRAWPTAADVRPPAGETVGLARAPFIAVDRAGAGPGDPTADRPAERIVGVPTVGVPTGAPIVDTDPPIEDIDCMRASVELGVAIVGIAVIPTVEVPIVGTDDGVLVAVPMVGVVDVRPVVVPPVESVVPATDVVVVPVPVVVAEPVVPSEVSAGSIVAKGPTPSLAAKELKSVAAPKPRVASKASKSGSAAAGMITAVSGGRLNAVALGTVAVAVTPPVVPVLNVEVCANASPGVATSATGAIHPMILFIPLPCRTSTFGSAVAARVSFRARQWDERTIRSKSFRSAFVRRQRR